MPSLTSHRAATAEARLVHPGPDGCRISRQRCVSPRMPAFFLAIALGLALVEIVILARTRGYGDEGNIALKIFLILFHLWFWSTLVHFVWWAAWRVTAIDRPGRISALARGLSMGAAVVAVAVYGISWGFYLRTGQFATLETIQFALSNGDMLWDYLRQAERTQIWAFGCVLTAAVALPTSFFVLMARWRPPMAPVGSRLGPRAICWWGMTLLLWVTLLSMVSDPIPQRRGVAIDLLLRRLNPVVALAASGEELLFGEMIGPILDTECLVPIARGEAPAPGATGKDRPSIVFVAIESLRHDVIHQRWQGREIMPTLNSLASRGLHLTHAYAQSTHSDYSDVCAYASLYPLRSRRHHYYRASDPWPKTLIYDLLKPEGYATAIFSSQNEAWGGMDQFLKGRGLDLFRDAQNSGQPTRISPHDTGAFQAMGSGAIHCGSLDDARTTDAAIAWIAEQAALGKPFFLGMNLQSSHFPYELSVESPRPFEPCAIDFDASFVSYPVEKVGVVRNAYFNALHYCDQQLDRLIAALGKVGRPDDTIIVVYGDNGEAFHENGLVTHAQAPFEPAIHVAAVVHAPGRLAPRVEVYPVELVDLVPTVLGIAGQPVHPSFQGIDVLSPERPAIERRLLFFHVENPIARADAVLLAGRWKFQLDRMSGRECLFDLESDPGELKDLIGLEPARAERLRRLLASWRKKQLAYYHYPFYYENYYPPRPPRLVGLD